MSRRLNIRNFTVANTDTGAMTQSGRDPTVYLSQATLLNDLSANRAVTNKSLTTITDASLNEHAHFSRSYIKIIRDYTQNISGADEVFIPDGIMRITFLSQQATYNSSLVYAFSAFPNTPIADLTWNVAIANTKAQVEGDYFDIQLPDATYYPTLYVCFLIVKDAWALRQIVSDNTCKISNVSRVHYCIHPQKCYYDRNRSHYIAAAGLDTTTGIKTRITFGVEDDRSGYYCDRYYNDLIFSLSSRTYLNETILLDDTGPTGDTGPTDYIYIIGGVNVLDEPQNKVYKFNGETIVESIPITTSGIFNGAVVYNDSIYSINTTELSNDIIKFNGTGWSQISPPVYDFNNPQYNYFSLGLNMVHLLVYNSELYICYIISYYATNIKTSSLYLFKFNGTSWQFVSKVDGFDIDTTASEINENTNSVVYNNKFYFYYNSVPNTLYSYDFNTSVSVIDDISMNRESCLCTHNGLLYAIKYDIMHVYNGTSWTTVQSYNTVSEQRFRYISAVSYNGSMYVLGGINNTMGVNNNVFVFNGTSWSTVQPNTDLFPYNFFPLNAGYVRYN